jgi:hypothetical protein
MMGRHGKLASLRTTADRRACWTSWILAPVAVSAYALGYVSLVLGSPKKQIRRTGA